MYTSSAPIDERRLLQAGMIVISRNDDDPSFLFIVSLSSGPEAPPL